MFSPFIVYFLECYVKMYLSAGNFHQAFAKNKANMNALEIFSRLISNKSKLSPVADGFSCLPVGFHKD